MKKLNGIIKNASIKNKRLILSFGILLIISLLIGISYSYYLISLKQEGKNEISSACFKLTFEDKNDISLTNVVPLTEEEGSNLVPYEFTIKNVCKMAANYQVNIETLNESTLETLYLRSKINDDSSVILGEQEKVETYINDDIKESRKISEGLLLENESVTYRLRVWVDNDSTVEQSSNKNWVGKVVVTALMNKNPYRTITLNPTGGRVDPTFIEVVEGRVIGELPIAERNGFTFNDWYTQETEGTQVTGESIYKENTEIYAHWNRNKYDLIVNPNEGEWDAYTSSQTYHLDYEEEKEINDPVRTGYHFTNWSVEGQESSINNKVFKMGYENATITANYEKNSYKLNVVDTYGSDEEVNLLYEEEKTIENPTREGYTFTGWEVEGSGSTIENNRFIMGYEDATLRAQWEANDYPYIALHYQENINDDNYTLVSADTEEGNLPYGTKKTPSVKTYTGFTSPQAKEITIEVDTYPPTKNKVEYQYSRNKYSITINPNEGTYNSSTTNTVINNVKYQKETTINDPTRDNYTFQGWTKEGNATLTNKVLTMGSENVTLTAVWKLNTYTITYNANGGSVSPGSATVNHGGTLTLPTPTRSSTAQYSYTFAGWYTACSGGTQVTNSTVWTSTQTICAHWTSTTRSYTLTVNNGTGSGTYAYGTNVTIRGTVPGSSSTGWSNNSTCTSSISGATRSYNTTSYSWKQWSDGNTTQSRSVTVTGNATYTAQFNSSTSTTTQTCKVTSCTGGSAEYYSYNCTVTRKTSGYANEDNTLTSQSGSYYNNANTRHYYYSFSGDNLTITAYIYENGSEKPCNCYSATNYYLGSTKMSKSGTPCVYTLNNSGCATYHSAVPCTNNYGWA